MKRETKWQCADQMWQENGNCAEQLVIAGIAGFFS